MKQILLFVGVFMFGISYGQEDTTKTLELQSVEVTGVRSDDKMPVTQSTIKSSDIEKTYQGEEVSIILDKTPSITSSSDGGHPQGYTYFRLRGIDQTRINMTLNGVPLNEPEDQGVYFSNYPGFTNNFQSAQIQRGVGTSSNGVSSYAGSINFEGATGLKEEYSVATTVGSFGTTRINGRASTGFIQDTRFAMYMNFSAFGTDGYKYNSGSLGNSFFLSGGYYGKKDVVKVTAFTGHSFNGMAWNAVSEDDIRIDPRTNYNTPNENDDFMQSHAQLQYTRRLASKSIINTTAYYNKLVGNWDLDLGALGFGTDILNYQLNSNFYGLMSNYKYVGDKLNLNLGVQGNMYDREHAMAIKPDVNSRLYTNTGYKNEISGFAKAGYNIDKLTFFADAQLRYATFQYDGDVDMPNLDWTFFNPKGGIVYNFNKSWRAYTSVGQSHREPTRNDMFMGEDNLIEYNEVKPEEVTDFELGTSFIKNKLSVAVNGYYMDFKNEITLIGALGSNGLPLFANVDNSFRSGVELQLQYELLKGLKLANNTNVSYNRINDNGESFQPLYTPPMVSNTTLSYSYKGMYIALNGKYHSTSYMDFANDYTIPSFFMMSGDIAYTYNHVSFMVKVYNITNTQYYTNGYAIDGTRYFYVNAPTSVYFTMKLSF